MSIQEPDLECRRVVELVTDYLEGALPTENTEQLEQHLLICDACMTYVDQHRTLIHTLAQPVAEPQAAPASAHKAALDLFRRLHKPSTKTEKP
jgi:anti-sigma factor RsiW